MTIGHNGPLPPISSILTLIPAPSLAAGSVRSEETTGPLDTSSLCSSPPSTDSELEDTRENFVVHEPQGEPEVSSSSSREKREDINSIDRISPLAPMSPDVLGPSKETKEVAQDPNSSKPAKTYKKVACPIPVCSGRMLYNAGSMHQHIRLSAIHRPDRAVPGWEKRWGIPEKSRAKMVLCPYIGCLSGEMRKDTQLDKHMLDKHSVDYEEWRFKVEQEGRRTKGSTPLGQ
ncbi:uncharacterized protein STEHIDRAFT_112805 [Stereum hirsutum FP-91666 SS1]|uniref:uncharacterized protein n=1 Tax=Stereum hirsutum (strain FP-91666) TaxID=721885 RepID=UPI000444A6D4|nr:uncharacterized protein STEHIDRAFT_112805 [Stereum hirsutum FP-91666 SS1]EIM84427.1 hypothetical protein STEHIDRAFT_112805 [Stereum hirsutum FP-91666 SS1]